MATAQDLLNKAEARKKKVPFTPEKRRSWDYSSKEPMNLVVIPAELKSRVEPINSEFVTHDHNVEKSVFSTSSVARSPEIVTNIPAINAEQISEQYGNKYRNETGNNSEQYRNSLEQSRNEIRDNQEQISEQSNNKNGNEIRNSFGATGVINHPVKSIKSSAETISLQNGKDEFHVLTLLRKTTGHQRKIMEQLTAHVKVMKEIINVINIPVSALSERINTDGDTIRTSIKRLQKKSILLKSHGERGRHGNTQVIMPNFIVKECFNLFNCIPQSLDEIGYRNGNDNRNDISYSSSNYIINKNTTTEGMNKNLNLPEEWLAIDITPLEHINFSKTQLKQLSDKNIPEIVQESINHFAYDLENGSKKYQDPLNVFMGVLRKGNAWTASGYESPKNKALRLYAEKTKHENEFREKTIEDLMVLEFDRWKENLSREEINNIIPEKDRNFCKENSAPWNAALKLHFKENVLIPRLVKEGVY